METRGRRWLVLASAVASFFAVGVGFFSVPPVLPALAARLAIDNLMAGVLMGSIAIPAIVLSLPLGAALDRWPARAAGAWGLALMAAGGDCAPALPGMPRCSPAASCSASADWRSTCSGRGCSRACSPDASCRWRWRCSSPPTR
jgi:MFS family permease